VAMTERTLPARLGKMWSTLIEKHDELAERYLALLQARCTLPLLAAIVRLTNRV